jgi:hypothetical protein
MNDPENFISRWSRRKRKAADADAARERLPEEAKSPPADTAAEVPSQADTRSPAEKDEKQGVEFDLSKLPSIDSITAETDIRMFLSPGVPPALTQAALRRAWVADPRIRDFIEVAENQWDFTVTGGAPGFDLSPPTGDIKQMLAQILAKSPVDESNEAGDVKPQDAPEPIETASHQNVTESGGRPNVDETAASERKKLAEHDPSDRKATSDKGDVAPQKDSATQGEGPAPKRGHGGAIPR